MEVKQDEITQEKWEEMRQIARRFVCAECGGELTVHTVAEKRTITVGCLNPDHHGWIERETWTQAFRRGEPVHPSIQAAIERKMIPKDDLGRAMNLLALRYPDAIKDPPTAALFIMDCARLDLDPLISPAEAVPVPFKSRKKDKKGNVIVEKITVQMVITGDGWLSMAARGCKEDWLGPPRIMRVEDYLMSLPEHKTRPLEEIEKIAHGIKKSDCKDEEAWYYIAIGKRRGMTEDAVIPGWFTHSDMKKAEAAHLPAANEPGNQATWRAQKKWVRKVYPECRQKMIEMTAEWYQRAEGIKAAQQYIDAEYSFISLPEGDEKSGEPPGGGEGEPGPTILSSLTQETKVTAEESAELEGEGFHINLTWLNESLKEIKWSDDTCKTFLVSQYKVSPQGSLEDVIKRLTREQAEEFVKELQTRAAQKQMDLWQ